MAGKDREATAETPVPGELFSLFGCIDEETCLELYGGGGCRSIGGVLFQTVGFMGGQITDVIDEDARLYQVEVDGVATGTVGADMTKYNIGDWVALTKVGTDFPTEGEGIYEERVPVTNGNVPTVDEYIIIPYLFAGA